MSIRAGESAPGKGQTQRHAGALGAEKQEGAREWQWAFSSPKTTLSACIASLSPIPCLLAFIHVLNAILILYLTKTYITHLYARHCPKRFANINSVNSHNNPTDEVLTRLSDGETEAHGR